MIMGPPAYQGALATFPLSLTDSDSLLIVTTRGLAHIGNDLPVHGRQVMVIGMAIFCFGKGFLPYRFIMTTRLKSLMLDLRASKTGFDQDLAESVVLIYRLPSTGCRF